MEGSSGQTVPSGKEEVQSAWRNKRRSLRLAIKLPVQWIRSGGTLDVSAADINLYGFFLATDQTTEPGRLIHLLVTLPRRPISMLVTARFVGKTMSGEGIGVEIFHMNEPDSADWRTYYRTLLRDPKASPNT